MVYTHGVWCYMPPQWRILLALISCYIPTIFSSYVVLSRSIPLTFPLNLHDIRTNIHFLYLYEIPIHRWLLPLFWYWKPIFHECGKEYSHYLLAIMLPKYSTLANPITNHPQLGFIGCTATWDDSLKPAQLLINGTVYYCVYHITLHPTC